MVCSLISRISSEFVAKVWCVAMIFAIATAAAQAAPLDTASYEISGVNFANAYAGPDIGAQINAAIAALPMTGGRVVVRPGLYPDVQTTISLDRPVRLECSTAYSCSITWAPGRNGVMCLPPARGSIFDGFSLVSATTQAEPHDGLTFACQSFTGRNLVIDNWGRDGVVGVSTPASAASLGSVNSNMWRLDNVLVTMARRDGFNMNGNDTNVGVCTNCHVFGYGRFGFFDNSLTNVYVQPSVTPAGASRGEFAYLIAGASHIFINPYCEAAAPARIVGIASRVVGTLFGPCTWVNSGGPTNVVDIPWMGYPATTSLALSPQPGTPSPVLYRWRNGVANAGRLDLVDETHGQQIWEYDPALPTLFVHKQLRGLYAVPPGDRSSMLATTAWASDAANLTHGTVPAARMPPMPLNATPEPTISSCGKEASIALYSSNGGGQFTTGSDATTICEISFATPWPVMAFCTITAANGVAAGASARPFVSASSGAGFSVRMAEGAMNAKFNYTCQGQ